jgi:hypothetical protein
MSSLAFKVMVKRGLIRGIGRHRGGFATVTQGQFITV